MEVTAKFLLICVSRKSVSVPPRTLSFDHGSCHCTLDSPAQSQTTYLFAWSLQQAASLKFLLKATYFNYTVMSLIFSTFAIAPSEMIF